MLVINLAIDLALRKSMDGFGILFCISSKMNREDSH